MPPSDHSSPEDVVLEDAPQHNSDDQPRRQSSDNTNVDNAANPKSKRIACVLCRKRKLRCDGTRPSCGTCKRLAHDCTYDEVRRKSGPKRGYVKQLETRLRQVETLLKANDGADSAPDAGQQKSGGPVPLAAMPAASQSIDAMNMNSSIGDFDALNMPTNLAATSPFNVTPNGDAGIEGQFSWEMIGLGLEEPLPPQETINELNQIYFEKIHPSIPMIHRPRYYAAMNLAPHMRPPICLRYIMWAHAASVTDKYEKNHAHFYQRARKYIEADEMRGHGESLITIAHCQTWNLITIYEFKRMYFPRAWLSTGRSVRLAQMMGLHRLDGSGLDVKQCVPPPRDWTEREERRRTFWMAFCNDRYASIGTGWPMTIEEKDVMTNLPATEEAFERSKPEQMISLAQALEPGGASSLTPTAGIVLMACLFGRNLTHLHRPSPEDKDHDLDGGFWKRHRSLENILSNTCLAMPDAMRLPTGLADPNVVFTNMNLHTSAICLHQAAIFKADKHRLPANVGSESRVRCVTAAAEIARIMRMISHTDLSAMNPFISFCLYVASRVFVQYLKFRPKDQQMSASLQFLMAAMNTLKRKNPLTESFLVQLDLDLEGSGVDIGQAKIDVNSGAMVGDCCHIAKVDGQLDAVTAANYAKGEIPHPLPGVDSIHCSPLFEIREIQKQNDPAILPGMSSRPPTFGENGLARHSEPRGPQQPPGPKTVSPGPPFHTARAHINMDYDDIGGFQTSIPLLTKRPYNTRIESLSPPSDMDPPSDHTSPSTHNSQSQRGGASSHTSFTPEGVSPPNMNTHDFSRTSTNSQPATISQETPGFFYPTDCDFAEFPSNVFPGVSADVPMDPSNFGISSWDTGGTMSGMNNVLSPTAWNNVLESMEGMQSWEPQVFAGESEYLRQQQS